MDLSPFPDFATASRITLETLQRHVGMALWLVTRSQGDDWIILDTSTEPAAYDVKPGDVLAWQETFCVRMVGGAPRVAPSSAAVPEYVDAPIGKRLTIGSYIGVPLRNPDGSLFGTLCAIDPAAQREELVHQLPMVELVARLLATVLEAERQREEASRRAEAAERGAHSDALTGLPNRRAWDDAVAREEARCRRYGDVATVLMVDLDGLKRTNDEHGHAAGDLLLRRAADALRGPLRETDLVARIGGDEFAILAPHTAREDAERLVGRLRGSLEAAGVAASIGVAQRASDGTIAQATASADRAMYADKLAHHRART